MPDPAKAQARLTAGLCVCCGAAKHVEGRVRCERCLLQSRAHAAARRARAQERGLCEACMKRKRAKGRGNRCTRCADYYLARQLERERAARAQARS